MLVIEFTNEHYLVQSLRKLLAEATLINTSINFSQCISNMYTYMQKYPTSPLSRWCVVYDDDKKTISSLCTLSDISCTNRKKDYEFLWVDNIYPLLQECECSICNKKESYVIQLWDKTIICRKCLNKLREAKQLNTEPA